MNISASPTSIAYSGTSLITWSSTNATSCSTPWGSTAIGGTYTTPALTGSMSYSVSCSGVGGVGSGMTTIAVGSPPLPILSLTASPSSVTYSGTSLIAWSSTNATSCVTPWGSTATGGTYTTPALTGSVSYSVSCSGVGGSVNGRVSVGISTGNLPLGTLIHDGPATPEQLSLYLPVTGPLPQTAVATVQYKKTNSSTWITGHPLFRIQPGYDADLSASGNSADAFAWPLIGMTPGATYNIEVTVTSSGISDIKTLTHTTRALPPAAGTPNKIITAGSTNAQIIAVLAIRRRQVRAKLRSLTAKRMACGTVLLEDHLAGFGVAAGRSQIVVEPPHLGQFFFTSRGSELAPMLCDLRVEFRFLE